MKKLIASAILTMSTSFTFAQEDIAGLYSYQWIGVNAVSSAGLSTLPDGAVTINVVAECRYSGSEYDDKTGEVLYEYDYSYWKGYVLTTAGVKIPGSEVRVDQYHRSSNIEVNFRLGGKDYNLSSEFYQTDAGHVGLVDGNISTRLSDMFVNGAVKIEGIRKTNAPSAQEVENLCGNEYGYSYPYGPKG